MSTFCSVFPLSACWGCVRCATSPMCSDPITFEQWHGSNCPPEEKHSFFAHVHKHSLYGYRSRSEAGIYSHSAFQGCSYFRTQADWVQELSGEIIDFYHQNDFLIHFFSSDDERVESSDTNWHNKTICNAQEILQPKTFTKGHLRQYTKILMLTVQECKWNKELWISQQPLAPQQRCDSLCSHGSSLLGGLELIQVAGSCAE